jgi:hypothetical protein
MVEKSDVVVEHAEFELVDDFGLLRRRRSGQRGAQKSCGKGGAQRDRHRVLAPNPLMPELLFSLKLAGFAELAKSGAIKGL